MTTRIIHSLAIACALSAGACDSAEKNAAKTGDKKADAKAGDKKADAKAGDAKVDAKADGGGAAEPADGPAQLSLDAIGLKAEGPAGATVGKAIGGSGVMVQAPGLVVTVSEATDSNPKTPDDAKKDAEMYTPKNWKVEEVEGGYIATFENTGGMGTNYWVNARREIDGKAYWCTTTASQAEQQANAVAFCKSLKK